MTRTDHTERLLEFLATPRTMPQICAKFGNDRRVRFTLNNAVARGHAQNLNIGAGRKAGGLFVRTHEPPPGRGPGRPANEPLTLDWRTGVHLQHVWVGQGASAQ